MNLIRLNSVFALMLLQPVYADEPATLDDVTVTARPVGLQSIEHISVPVNLLSGDALKERQSSTIGETLENIPGVTTNRFSPLASRPIIRGQGGARVQVLENGLGSMDVSTISVDHVVSIDPLQAEKIEIFRGPATLLYGSEASGGLVNVVTNRIPEYVPESFSPKLYSSYNTNSNESVVSFQAEGGYENLAFHIDGLNRNAQNYDDKDNTIENSFYDSSNFNIGGSLVENWGHFGMAFGHFDSTHGIPRNPEEPDEVPFIESEQDRIDLSAQWNNPVAGIRAINVQGGYTDYTHTEFEDINTAGTVFSNEQFEGRVELLHAPIGVFTGVIGTQFGYRDVSAAGDEAFIPKTNTDTFSIFILEDTDVIENVHFEIGGRYEHNESDPDNAGSVSFDLVSISSGIHWHFTEEMALSFNLSRSQRAPAAEELFANGPHHATETFELGQASLGEETSHNIDLGLAREEGIFKWNVNLFVNYIEDYIFLQGLDRNGDGEVDEVDENGALGGELQLVQYQADDTLFYGFEAAASLNLYTGNNGQLDLNLFTDYVRAERDNDDNIARISPARIGTGLDYQYGNFKSGIDFTSVLAQKDNAPLETDTNGYSLLNLHAGYDVVVSRAKLNVFLKATNLMNEDGEVHTSFIKNRAPIMGRALTVGFQGEF